MKMFLLKDMSGRDAVATVNTAHVLKHFGDDRVTVQAWVKNAKVGDKLACADFSVHSTIIICIADGGR